MHRILALNVGSTSVKIALFEDGHAASSGSVPLAAASTGERVPAVVQAARAFLAESGARLEDLSAIAARGGLLRPLAGGTYRVDVSMLEDLRHSRFGEHPSNVSAIAAHELGAAAGIPSYVVDPVTVDEMENEARITGVPSIRRRSVFHALSQKAAARRAAREMGKRYEQARLIVAHLGGGISVGAHRDGRVVDVNNALDGDGPMAPERAGSVPAGELAALCFSGRFTPRDVKRMLTGGGGMVAHLQTSDMRVVEQKIAAGDANAEGLVRAMGVAIARHVGAMAAVLHGRVDAVVVTGAMAGWQRLVREVRARTEFIAPVIVYSENLEMEALALGVLRVLTGEEEARQY